MNPVGRSEIPKAVAMTAIARFFEAGGCTTVEVLAEKYEKSPRAIQRWLGDIDRHILPLARRPGTPYWRKWESE